MSQFDLIVRAGTVFDGTGSESFTADIGVKDGVIREIGRINAKTYHCVFLEHTQAAHYSAVLCCGHKKLILKMNQNDSR